MSIFINNPPVNHFNAALVAAQISYVEKTFVDLLDSDGRLKLGDPFITAENARVIALENLRALKSCFSTTAGSSLGEILQSRAALNGIRQISPATLLTLEKYADPDLSYQARAQLSERLRGISIEENLSGAGFRRSGSSEFYYLDQFVVSTALAKPTIYIPFKGTVNRQVLKILNYDQNGEPALTIIMKNERGHTLERSFTAYGRSVGGGTWALSNRLTLEEQLSSSGFVQDAASPTVYRRALDHKLGHPNSIPELIALVESDQLIALLQAASPTIQDKIGPSTRFVGSDLVPLEGGKTEAALTITSDLMEFKVSPRGKIVDGSQYLFREIPADVLGIQPIATMVEDCGFIVGATNHADIIRGLTSLNGLPIELIELEMKKPHYIIGHYLDPGRNLLDVLAAASNFVLEKDLTHQELAAHLKYAMRISQHKFGGEFEYRGQAFQITREDHMVSWESPFGDGMTSTIYCLTNLSSGQEIRFLGTLPEMIEKYGFYGEQVSAQQLFELYYPS